ncbi:Crinkler (CRN) family protein [Thraustotheca clavata]|uniref:Crinkler (CRN) family protein n=1 Tax=Thraustotheca clavata TaxID=74557 RepID=A0A1V9YE61_9STRA|nr:Crinkler (CRN) family protein [Thraustotheca clavata]
MIPLNAEVADLIESIYTKECYAENTKFAPSALKLYLTRKDGVWMKHNETTRDFLKSNNSDGYTKMLSSWVLCQDELFGTNFDPIRGDIHVLVRLPEVNQHSNLRDGEIKHSFKESLLQREQIKETIDKNYTDELRYYKERGQLIQRQCPVYCADILKTISTIYSTDPTSPFPLPFICVEGSSGMGKSQLAFTLFGQRPYYYLLAIETTAQFIYGNFDSISNAFNVCVEKDNPKGQEEADILSTQSTFYQTEKLWTYGSIYALLKYSNSEEYQTNLEMIHFNNEMSFVV